MFVAIAGCVTATLTLDAAVVLLTPVILQTTVALRIPARPHAYAGVELANAGSLLLPVSNLTNLLAFTAAGLSFAHFTALMALPWLAAMTIQWLGLRWFFRRDLEVEPESAAPMLVPPRYALGVLALTVAGFVITSAVSVSPAWAALAGALLLGGPALRRGSTSALKILESASLGFCAFVFALAVIVEGVTRHGLNRDLGRLVPAGSSLFAVIGLALLAATLANVVNNLPATLALLPLVSGSPAAVLAVLIGVNIGPNATYAGSLATLLWRRQLPDSDRARARDFHLYGALTVIPSLVATTVLMWLGVQLFGV
jgi:arsenical pump membrane protein